MVCHRGIWIRGLLRWAALFLGELRDGLTMINMQSAFLIVSKNYTEKQAGILFFGTCIVYPDTHIYIIYIYIPVLEYTIL